MQWIIVICFLKEKIYKFKANNKNINLPSQFSLGSISNKFDYVKLQEISLKGNVYDMIFLLFPVSVKMKIKKIFKEEEPIEILKILDLIENI